jgi:hypothetical protein
MVIITRQDYGWSAMFFGFEKMPEDVEIPLPLTSEATLSDVMWHIRKSFPNTRFQYRDGDKLLPCPTRTL